MVETDPIVPPIEGADPVIDDPDDTEPKYTDAELKERIEKAVKGRFKKFVPKDEHERIAARAQELEDAAIALQNENQKLKAVQAEKNRAELRAKVGAEMDVPENMRKYITGNDEEAMKASAEALRKDLGIKQEYGKAVPPNQPTAENEHDFMNSYMLGMARGGSGR